MISLSTDSIDLVRQFYDFEFDVRLGPGSGRPGGALRREAANRWVHRPPCHVLGCTRSRHERDNFSDTNKC
jgi:hypothetical protein